METRPLGRTGLRVSEIGLCVPDAPASEDLIRRAVEKGCTFILREGRPHVVPWKPEAPPDYVSVPYNLIEQTAANLEIGRLARERRGIVATRVLAGGARMDRFLFLVCPGRTLVQAAIQFVLANESVSCALVRVARPEHLDEVLSAPDAPPLTGQELEQIFETYANRFDP